MSARRLAAAAVSIAFLLPEKRLERTPTVCLFRRITGRPCPTCGLTRSWRASAHGHLGEALSWHPFGPLTFGVAILVAVRGPRAIEHRGLHDPRVAGVLAALWIAAWIRRLRS